ncbi:hypothetical protein AN395_03659 [Pseudoalteromonas sp. P1-30]|uniref:hypothetical protein n=1 Tax=Pseudoalteromonas sp. P1-30 TaxID=1723760 RepID=UPI0006D5D6EA|nr:hypothetical protein [Pseudoalteromonas sp. P1-30]KPV89988.1 hypothetical protein AN395_03659 [Pseudoalteromonas sp. P1-30]
MSDICIQNNCNIPAMFNGECALHCNKSDYQTDKMNGKLKEFYDDLEYHIRKNVLKNSSEEPKKEIASGKYAQENLPTKKQKIIHLRQIKFPERDPRDEFDFFKLLKQFKGIHFDDSTIYFGSINLPNVQLFFQDCIFLNDWSIHSFLMIEDVTERTIFQNCVFQGAVTSASPESAIDKLEIESYLFNDCTFKCQVIFHRGTYLKSIFFNSEGFIQKICNLHIENCEFKERLLLNKSEIEVLKIQNMEFEGKVELKECDTKYTLISNVNFKSLFDAYKTKFNQFKMNRSIFDDFSGFEKCEFGCVGSTSLEKIEFEYVTFLNFTNFRKAKFYSGLDFEHTNLKESPNFLNAEINYKNTNRETFRIIKHSFDKIGNQIEANKYFALEMKKYKEELKAKNGFSAEKAVLWLNESISNFGSSIFTPLSLMLVTAIIYYFLILGYENNYVYKIYEPLNEYIISISKNLNALAKGIPPYGRFLKEGMEFVTLIYHIFFLTFTWHFIVAVKRCTKR